MMGIVMDYGAGPRALALVEVEMLMTLDDKWTKE